eukprot:8271806-Pyramimonas_sp.AAC.1
MACALCSARGVSTISSELACPHPAIFPCQATNRSEGVCSAASIPASWGIPAHAPPPYAPLGPPARRPSRGRGPPVLSASRQGEPVPVSYTHLRAHETGAYL